MLAEVPQVFVINHKKGRSIMLGYQAPPPVTKKNTLITSIVLYVLGVLLLFIGWKVDDPYWIISASGFAAIFFGTVALLAWFSFVIEDWRKRRKEQSES